MTNQLQLSSNQSWVSELELWLKQVSEFELSLFLSPKP
jgi:hypothetical protein